MTCVKLENFEELEMLGQSYMLVDPLEEVDVGDGTIPRSSFVNKKFKSDRKDKLIELLKEYLYCFVWFYFEMLDLSHELVEHRLPIKEGFRPYTQPSRRFNPEIYDRVKEEVNRLLDVNFIRPCRYADWISNIVLVEKKGSGKIRICIDFCNLN